MAGARTGFAVVGWLLATVGLALLWLGVLTSDLPLTFRGDLGLGENCGTVRRKLSRLQPCVSRLHRERAHMIIFVIVGAVLIVPGVVAMLRCFALGTAQLLRAGVTLGVVGAVSVVALFVHYNGYVGGDEGGLEHLFANRVHSWIFFVGLLLIPVGYACAFRLGVISRGRPAGPAPPRDAASSAGGAEP